VGAAPRGVRRAAASSRAVDAQRARVPVAPVQPHRLVAAAVSDHAPTRPRAL
jgi:hypothetical protein